MERQVKELLRVYHVLGWIDMALVIFQGMYMMQIVSAILETYEMDYFMANAATLLAAYTTWVGISLAAIFIVICVVNIALSRKLRRLGEVGILTMGFRYIWNGAWIVLDVWYLAMVFGIL